MQTWGVSAVLLKAISSLLVFFWGRWSPGLCDGRLGFGFSCSQIQRATFSSHLQEDDAHPHQGLEAQEGWDGEGAEKQTDGISAWFCWLAEVPADAGAADGGPNQTTLLSFAHSPSLTLRQSLLILQSAVLIWSLGCVNEQLQRAYAN